MAATHSSSSENLPKVFQQAWTLFDEIEDGEESPSSDSLQAKIKEACKLFLKSTQMVNALHLFSRNEDLSEISCANLKYLLLPAFLGELCLKENTEDRRTAVSNSKIYFMDFLERCQSYGLTSKGFCIPTEESCTGKKSINEMNSTRQEKIQRYKQTKELKEKIKGMKSQIIAHPETLDDDLLRDCLLAWIQLWINNAVENLTTINTELEILAHMSRVKGREQQPVVPRHDLKPMKPLLITRETLKNQVFGAGYRSLPTMTEDEWFEKELREGKIVLDYQSTQGKPSESKSDSDEDVDSEEKLQKQREWDEWKDTHRRGEGNKDRHG